MRIVTLAVAAIAAFVSVSSAATFNFESLATSTGGGYTSVNQTSGGLTLGLTRESGGHFDISNISFAAPASWGSRTLDPFIEEANATAFIGNFSAPVSFVQIEAGDAGADFPDVLQIQAYSGPNGTGTLLTSDSQAYTGAAFPLIVTASVSSPLIQSIKFIGGTPGFPNSLYYDNITASVAAVPVPASAIAGLVLLVTLAGWRMISRRANA